MINEAIDVDIANVEKNIVIEVNDVDVEKTNDFIEVVDNEKVEKNEVVNAMTFDFACFLRTCSWNLSFIVEFDKTMSTCKIWLFAFRDQLSFFFN